MKYGWKTRIDERRYFEEKLQARQDRIVKAAIDSYKIEAWGAQYGIGAIEGSAFSAAQQMYQKHEILGDGSNG